VKNGSEKVYQAFWELVSKRTATNLKALGKAFKSAKNITLAQAFHDASIALRFSRDCSDPRYCLEEGSAYLATPTPPGDEHPGDHDTLGPLDEPLPRKIANDLSMNWIGLPTQNNLRVQVTHDGGKGVLKVSIACRNGNEVTVEGSGTATSGDPEVDLQNLDLLVCEEATAVISNVKVTSATPKKTTRTDYTIAIIN
jgi:ATP-dependent DNA ligase